MNTTSLTSARLLCLLAGLALAPLAGGQPAQAQPVAPPADQATATPQTAQPTLGPLDLAAIPAATKARLSVAMARTALLDLRGIADPTPEDLTLTSAYLRRAHLMDPTNTQTIRRWVEAAFAAGDDAAVLEGSRALVKADPTDTVALLRVISSQLRNANTAQDRLAQYGRFIETERIDASVRSRLALDAAMLARETGDEKKFTQLLQRATQLDSTNKDAAVLLFTYVTQRAKSDFERVEALNNLLMADPADPGVHAQLRDLLSSNGAWIAAARFDANVRRMLGPDQLGPNERLQELAITFRKDGANVALRDLVGDLNTARTQQERIFKSTDKEDQENFNIRRPEEIRLAAVLEELRTAAAVAVKRPEAVEMALLDMQASAEEAIATLKDPIRRGEDVSEADAMLAATDIEANWTLWQMLAEHKVADAQARATKLLETLADIDPRVPELKAWIALRSGDAAGALAVAQGETPSAWLGAAHALALQSQGKKTEAIAQLNAIEYAEPLTGLGAWASAQAAQLGATPGPLARQLDTYTRTIPAWVDSIVTAPTTIQRLSVDHERSTATATDSVNVVIRLKNISPVPLGLGTQRTLESRMLLAPDLRLSPTSFQNFVQVEVLDLARQLRLMPGQEMRVTFDPSDTMIGWLSETISQGPTATRYRLIQGFTTNDEGERRAGPGCLDVATGSLSRQPNAEARLTAEQLAQRLDNASEDVLPALLIGIRAMLINALAQGEEGPNIAPLLASLEAKYPTWPAHIRLLALLELPALGEIPALTSWADLSRGESDPDIKAWILLTRVGAPDDPYIAACEQRGDPELARLAALTRDRLTRQTKTYALRGALGVIAADKPAESQTGK